MPEVIYTSQGVYWAYWVDFTDPTVPGGQRMGVARSVDGIHWEKLGVVNFTGLEQRGPGPADPDVMELPDGRLRMYFFRERTVYSALSTDGINYTVEEGYRLTADEIWDPNVIRLPDGRYRMYLNHRDIISASSDDGMTFTLDDGVRVQRGAVPGAPGCWQSHAARRAFGSIAPPTACSLTRRRRLRRPAVFRTCSSCPMGGCGCM
ncbi:MAG: hypothetical protein H5T65_11030 [Chloroflexi bacterium]|nr:hypothetical protein [Chloroflexota bacterium]